MRRSLFPRARRSRRAAPRETLRPERTRSPIEGSMALDPIHRWRSASASFMTSKPKYLEQPTKARFRSSTTDAPCLLCQRHSPFGTSGCNRLGISANCASIPLLPPPSSRPPSPSCVSSLSSSPHTMVVWVSHARPVYPSKHLHSPDVRSHSPRPAHSMFSTSTLAKATSESRVSSSVTSRTSQLAGS